MKRTTLSVQGMYSDSDAGNIRRSLEARHGVVNVTVNVQQRTVIVEHDSQSGSDFVQALASLRFTARVIQTTNS
ncbi:hypothetical protein SUGI_0103250 [Cryptomeria japonica]|nr:hypothetical protein SUGI_0103250 [Cryptomeria japonica]